MHLMQNEKNYFHCVENNAGTTKQAKYTRF